MKTYSSLIFLVLFLALFTAKAQWQSTSKSGRCLYVDDGNGKIFIGGYNNIPSSQEPDDLFFSLDGIKFNGFLLDEINAVLVESIVSPSKDKTLVGVKSQRLYQGVGTKWSVVSTFPAAEILFLASFGTTIYAGTDSKGIYRSSNGGDSWTSTTGILYPVKVILKTSGGKFLAATNGGGIYQSTDGAAWSQSNLGLGNMSAFTLCEFNKNIYVGTAKGIYRSSNDGNFWTPLNSDFSNVYSITAFNNKKLFAGMQGGGGVFQSTNEGQTWNSITKDIPSKNIYSLAVFRSWLFAATDSEVYKISLDSLNGSQKNIDTTINIFGGMDAKLEINKSLAESKNIIVPRYDFRYTIGGNTSPVQNNIDGFTISSSSSTNFCTWTAPYLDDDIKKYDGSTESNKLIVTCKLSDANKPDEASDVARFTISVTPSLVSPANDAENIDYNTPNYTWRKIPGVSSYSLQVRDDKSPYPLTEDTTSDTTFINAPSLQNLNPEKKYYWRIIAKGASDTIIGERSFTTTYTPLSISQSDGKPSICKPGDSIRLRATGQDGKKIAYQNGYKGYHYIWTKDDGSAIPPEIKQQGGDISSDTLILKPKSAINIKCVVQDQINSITANFSITIGNPSAKITTSSGTDYFCSGSSLTLSLDKPYSKIEWYNGSQIIDTGKTYTVKNAGTYTVKAYISEDCFASDTKTIVKRPPLSPIIQGTSTVCIGSTSSYSINYNSLLISSKSWEVTSGNELVDATNFQSKGELKFLNKGIVTIRVSVTDTAGCSGVSDGFNITIGDSLHPKINGNIQFCKGSSTILTTDANTSYTYDWFRNSIKIPDSNSHQLTVKDPGDYYVKISTGSCSGSSDIIKITENPSPDTTVSIDYPTSSLSANDGVAWQWYHGIPPNIVEIKDAVNKTHEIDSVGDYTVRIASKDDCIAYGTYNVPSIQIGTLTLTWADGNDTIHSSFSKTMQDFKQVQVRASNVNANAPELGVAFYRIKLSWNSKTIGMASWRPDSIIISNDAVATLEYIIDLSKIKNNSVVDTFNFLALIGGIQSADITLQTTALNKNKRPMNFLKIDSKPAYLILDSAAILNRSEEIYIASVTPNPAQNESIVKINSQTAIIDQIDVYLTDITGKKIVYLKNKGDGIYTVDCTNIVTGNYLIIADDGTTKHSVVLRIEH